VWLSIVSLVLGLFIASPVFAFDFDLENGKLSDLSTWVATVTGKNIIIPSSLDVPVTLNIKAVPLDAVFPMFQSVVRSTGNSLDKDGNFYIVSPGLSLPAGPVDSRGAAEAGPVDMETLFQEVKLDPCQIFAVNALNINVNTLLPALSVLVNSGLCFGESAFVPPGGNVLLINTTSERIEDIKAIISVLDVPASRLLVRAVVFEESLTDAENLGVNLSAGGMSGLIKSLAPGVALSPVAGGGVLSMIRGDFELLANAVISSDRVKILSTPEILLDDRSQGRVSVGQNVPFITGQFKTNETGGTDTFQTIERHDVGVSLSVSPVVLSPGVFKLQIQQDASSVSSSTVASDVITNTRNINTVVTVHAGEVIYLGGLYSEDSNGSDIVVPLLSKIPVLGWLFKSHKTEIIKRRLSVILSVETV
jgi:general secretion pathway protein D